MKRLLASIAAGLAGLLMVVVPASIPPALATTCSVGTADTSTILAHGTVNAHLDESSGVVASSDYTTTQTVWDHEDQGNGPYVYAHNGNNGNLRATVTLNGVTNSAAGSTDWEDIAIARTTGTDTVVISDTGNNNNPSRTNTALYAFSEPDPANGDVTLTPTIYPIKFVNTAGGSRVFPDVEAMVIDQGGASTKDVLFFAKENGGGGRTDFAVYDAGQFNSLTTGTNEAVKFTTIGGVSSGSWNAPNNVRTGPVAADIDVNRDYLIVKNYAEGLLWPRNGTWVNTLTTSQDASSCGVLSTGSGKYEGVAFSYDVSQVFQVKDDSGCSCDTPLKKQSFTYTP